MSLFQLDERCADRAPPSPPPLCHVMAAAPPSSQSDDTIWRAHLWHVRSAPTIVTVSLEGLEEGDNPWHVHGACARGSRTPPRHGRAAP
eukprot:940879-Prymnesium_polylepis.1